MHYIRVMKPANGDKRFWLFKHSILIFLISLFSNHAIAQQAFNKENLLKDLDAYRDSMIANEVTLIKKSAKRDFAKRVQAIKATAASKNTDELLVEIMKLSASLGNEHIFIVNYNSPYMPVRCFWYDEGIYIVDTDSSDTTYLYNKVLAVNNVPIADVVKQIATLLPSKNESYIKNAVPEYLDAIRALHGLGIIPNTDSVTFTLASEKEDTIQKTFTCYTEPDSLIGDTARYKCEPNYWFRHDSGQSYMYLRYSLCFPEADYAVQQLAADFFREIKEKRSTKIIIDLRWNAGGLLDNFDPFIEQLRLSKYDKPDTVIVLIGCETFSAGVSCIYDMRNVKPVITIGEITSGDINEHVGVQDFVLPNTDIHVSYSMYYMVNVTDAKGPVVPDIYVPRRFKDFREGRDAALDTAIKYKFQNKP